MPLLHLEQMNDAPIPVVQQADAVNGGKWSTRDNGPHGDGREFTITQLLEDVTAPILKRKVSTVGLNTWDAIQAEAVNKYKQTTIDSIGNDPAFENNRKQWMVYWNQAFQMNPGEDLSQKISDAVWALIDPSTPTPGKYSDFVAAIKKGPTGLVDMLVQAIDEVMKDLPNQVTRKTIDYNTLQTAMDDKLNAVLHDFNLDATEDATDLDVIAFKELKDKANDKLDETFEALDQKRTDRPYRNGFSQKTLEDAVTKEFEDSYSNSEWPNRLAMAALKKAKKKLQEILDKAKADALDTRTLDVIVQFNEWVHKQKSPQPVTPPELFKSLLGDATGQKFLDWMKEWGHLLIVSHTESVVPDPATGGEKVVISMGVSLIDGATPVTGQPSLKVDYKWLNAAGRDTKEQTVMTVPLSVKKSSYSTDMALDAYKAIISRLTPKSTMSEDNFRDFLALQATDMSSIKSGTKWMGISLADMEKLNPEVFKDFQKVLDKIKDDANHQQYATGSTPWTSNLVATFDVEYIEKNGVMRLNITPHIADDKITSIPPIEWDPSIPTGQAAKDTTKNEIAGLFTAADKLHESITDPIAHSITEKIVAPLFSKATEVYEALDSQEKAPYPFLIEYVGDVKVGEEVPLKFMEENYPNAAKALSYFDDPTSRFKIKFIIIDTKDKEMSVSYVITDSTVADTSDPFYSTAVNNNEENKPLKVMGIKFNQEDNKAQTWLDELAKSEKGKYETTDDQNFDHKQYVDDIANRVKPIAMTDAEFDAIFKEFKTIAGNALNMDKVTIVKGKVEYDAKTERWMQYFIASYTADSGKVVKEEKALPFTERFLDPIEITDLKKDIKDKTKAATKVIEKSSMTDQEKKDFLAQMNAERSALEDQIAAYNKNPAEPDMHEGQAQELREAAAEFDSKAKEAIHDSLLNKVKDKIVDHFGDISKVPPKILEFLAKYPDSMMKIVENNPGLLDNIPELTKLLEKYGDSLDPNAIMSAQKTLQQSGKWFLLSLGSILGLGAGLGVANSVKVATTNKKSVSSTGKIKSSKKLAIISALIGLASAAGSVATLVYLFVAQGGL